MSNFICGSLRTVDLDDSATIAMAKRIYAETARLGIAIQMGTTAFSENSPDIANLPDDAIRKASIFAASKIEGNLIFNLLANPLSNNGGSLLHDLNYPFGKDPEDAPLIKFMKWLLNSGSFDSAAIYIELDTVLMEIAGELEHDPDEPYNEFKCTKEEFLENLHEYFPRKQDGGGEGLFIIQI